METWPAAIVAVEYPSAVTPLEPLVRKVVVPAHLLWSPEGMAAIFTKLREDQLGPPEKCEPRVWRGFHITGIETPERLNVLTVAWEDPEPYPHNGRKRRKGNRAG
ncbi:MAG: hypothetical protein M1541_14475 [Acidobacteria bacterium]|nr:hypothetical protein [Acidobacteriota bacterium]